MPIFNTVQFSHTVMSNSLLPPWTAAQQASLSPFSRFEQYHHCSNSCPSSRWCHPTISSSVVPFSSCLQSFPASGSFPMSQLFASGSQSMELWLQHQSFQWIFRTDFLYDWLVWSPCSPGILKSLLQHHSSKASVFLCSAFFIIQLSHPYMTTGKTIAMTRWTFVGKDVSAFWYAV